MKAISYILIPILVIALGFSIFSIEIEGNLYYNKEKFFKSEAFVSSYMDYLSNEAYHLIHNSNLYSVLQDGETEIHYSLDDEKYYNDIKNRYFLIIYKNKALTNVELTAQTNTIDGIKNFIQNNENSLKVNIINGNIESDSEIIQSIGMQYLSRFNLRYYTVQLTEETNEDITNGQTIEYITATAEDFQIYSSYVEDFADSSEVAEINKIMDKISIFNDYRYFIVPTSAVLLLLIIIYLLISIGYKKGEEGIALNDFDKIPLEVIIFLAVCIGCLSFVPLMSINKDFNAIVSFMATGILVVYVLCVITLHTIIKRIKSRTFVKTTLIGRFSIWIWKGIKKLINKIKEMWKTYLYSRSITTRVLIDCAKIGIIALLILLIFGNTFLTFLLELAFICVIIYRVIKIFKQFSLIENKLKEMYEGNNSNKLDETEFEPQFSNIVKYINDISNGFENAIQDRMKSERFKAELITNVSHDIKTPLTSIINYVDLLKQENIENEKAKEYIGILDNKSQRLKKLTEDLVEASKVSTGNITLNLEKINIVELIKQAAGEFEDKFEKRGLKTIIDAKTNEINIMADSRYMYRVIENLFSNISKYAMENSRVYIDIKTINQKVIIEIKNISKDKLNISAEELMQRFVRGDKSRNTEGSGLGLSIAQNLTELQNGVFKLKLDGDLFKVELEFETIKMQ